MSRIRLHSGRRSRVTQEPLIIADSMLGRPLGSFRRRAAAIICDMVVMGCLFLPIFAGLSLLSLHREDPGLLPAFRAWRASPSGEERAALSRDALFRFCRILAQRRPEILEPEALAAIEAGDPEKFREVFGDDDTNVVITATDETTIVHQGDERRVILGTDVLLGEYSSFLSWGAAVVGWFTLVPWLFRGRSPGKWIFRLRVARLDGRRLTLWDCFGRAGGYGASAATVFLGFLEAAWHPNRQAMHDRIAATVVLRDPSPRRRSQLED